MTVSKEFATYACDLLAGVGPCVAKRMFGGWGISTDGLTVAILADLGSGEKLWLKANDETAAQFRAARCEQFTYPMKSAKAAGGVELKSMNYFAAPDEAMDSPGFMLPWARLALQAALQAQALKVATLARKTAKPALKKVSKNQK
jgi:DNA transformation protein